MRFDSLTSRGDDQRYAIRTGGGGSTAPATKQKDALESARRRPAARSSARWSAARKAAGRDGGRWRRRHRRGAFDPRKEVHLAKGAASRFASLLR